MGYIDYMLHVIPVIPSSCTVMLISTEHFTAVVLLCCVVLQVVGELNGN